MVGRVGTLCPQLLGITGGCYGGSEVLSSNMAEIKQLLSGGAEMALSDATDLTALGWS